MLHQKQNTPKETFCNNKSTIALCKNPVFHGRSRHINFRFHKIQELVAQNEVLSNVTLKSKLHIFLPNH